MTLRSSRNPFPGLRPFEMEEHHLFFGRDGQSDELLRQLRRHSFVAVLGVSGSGKSSLVRAGLFPALYGGMMSSVGSDWRIVVCRPGGDPYRNLARSLALSRPLDHPDFPLQLTKNQTILMAMVEATLRRNVNGVSEALRLPRVEKSKNYLIVVDQFEELFRFKSLGSSNSSYNEAAAYVKLLLKATKQNEIPIYLTLTMRSEYLGECAQFRDLPEMINQSQYLIPRMTRQQRQEAITGPIRVHGGEITQPLVQQLLNEVGDNPDQLPVLQHALMRTWNGWKIDHKNKDPIDLRHYRSIGGMNEALSLHADTAYEELGHGRSEAEGARCKEIAQKLFRCITELGPDNRGIRRQTRLGEIANIVGVSQEKLVPIIDTFRQNSRSFLMPRSTINWKEIP